MVFMYEIDLEDFLDSYRDFGLDGIEENFTHAIRKQFDDEAAHIQMLCESLLQAERDCVLYGRFLGL